MAKIHIVLQGKGGVGKSVIAALLAQYLQSKGKKPICIDTDPVNATFHGYKGLGAKHLQIMEDNVINARNFDSLVETISTTKADAVIDNGASSFIPLTEYLISNQVFQLFAEMGHQVIIHMVVTGGQALADTTTGVDQLIKQIPVEGQVVIWLNPYWGPIEHEGKDFEHLGVYLKHKARMSAIIRIPALKEETYGRDLSDMLQARQTFDEALATKSLTIMTRQRLKIVKGLVFDQLENAPVLA